MENIGWSIIYGLQWLIADYLVAAGIPFYMGMEALGLLAALAAIITLAWIASKFNKEPSPTAYTVIGGLGFLFMGSAIAVTPLGPVILIVEVLVTAPVILVLSGIRNGYAFNRSGAVNVVAIGSDSSKLVLDAQPDTYIGPGDQMPRPQERAKAIAMTAEMLIGNNQQVRELIAKK